MLNKEYIYIYVCIVHITLYHYRIEHFKVYSYSTVYITVYYQRFHGNRKALTCIWKETYFTKKATADFYMSLS